MTNTPTVHNSANYGDIAKIVLMPGDPLRAKFIAENYLENVVCFNELRGMLGFTGIYKGKKVSVMGSGMGMPSIGIYSYELFKFYDVEKIIRIGSCGGYSEDLELLDTILVDNAYSESTFALTFNSCKDNLLSGSKELTDILSNVADRLNIKVKRGTVLTSDGFDYYIDVKSLLGRIPQEIKCIGAEMECFGLFHVANSLNKKAACLLSVVDSHTKKTLVSPKDREKSLKNMIEIALESVLE
ncbi:MAG: deoD [Clostridia bacterium]|jgi:purine-nucleoside phosphorylase|nr:deoD [Clostridia bacterium]